jgi:hypothetical protein
MINLDKEVVFKDGISLDNGVEDLTDSFLDHVEHIIEVGKSFGLSLDRFEITDELVYFEWRGTKRDMLRFFTYYSKNMTIESFEKRKETQKIILNK